MEPNDGERDLAERDPGMCVCKGGPTLEILKEIQRLYEERMEQIDKTSGSTKMQQQVEVLRSWVSDLVGQNTLLTRAVEELETEATTKLLLERRKNSEVVSELHAECAALRRRLARKDSDLRGLVEVLRRLREFDYCTLDGIHFFEVTESDIFGSVEWRQKKMDQGDSKHRNTLKQDTSKYKSSKHFKVISSKNLACNTMSELKLLNESLHKENIAKEREIRQLNKDAQTYEQTIMNLRKEMSSCKNHKPEVCKKDAEVMAGMVCTGNECGEWEPTKDFSELLRDETLKYQERVQKMEANLKSSGDSIRALRKVNVSLSEEMHSMRRVCAALDEQCRAANMRAQFKDDIIKEMRRQLKQAKAKATTCSPETSSASTSTTFSLVPFISCTTSMPNISVIERSTSAPILVSDASIADLQCQFKGVQKNENTQTNFVVAIISPKDSVQSCLTDSPSTCIKKDSRIYSRRDFPKDFFKQKTTSCGKEIPKSCLKNSPSRCGGIQIREKEDKPACVKELYFNDEAKRSCASSPRGHCCNDGIDIKMVRPVCSAEVMTNIEKDVKNQACGKIAKDSGATCSLMDSTSGTCDESSMYYQNKLMATLQILRNKEQTISVQADSLAVAEERIATLNERANELKRELDRKNKEYTALRKSVECCKVVEQNDVCIVTERPMEDQRDIVSTLENNLSVIEDLYRECFYETAKQENLIEMLRSSYLDVRLMDKQKADHIGRLQNVINTQKWSLDRCQDIAMEVDGLKMEISNFLNSSTSTNNDSGMWERSEESFPSAPGVQEDLQDITEQLLRLQDVLAVGCSCGLNEENMKLKQKAANLEIKLTELRGELCELECKVAGKKDNDMQFKTVIEAKEHELRVLRDQLLRVQEGSHEQISTQDAMACQLQQMKALVGEKTAAIAKLQCENESQAQKIKDLEEELQKADAIIKENCKMRSEVSYLSTQVSLWRAQLDESKRHVHALETELERTRAHCTHIDECYRQKASSVVELQAHLEEAHARGTQLCGEARRAVCAVRHWMRRMRDKQRDQENLIKEKDALLTALQQRIEERQCSESQPTSASENTASCSKCLSSRDERSFCPQRERRREHYDGPNQSDIASCSTNPVPIRLVKKSQCGNKRCAAWMCGALLQEPVRREAGQGGRTGRSPPLSRTGRSPPPSRPARSPPPSRPGRSPPPSRSTRSPPPSPGSSPRRAERPCAHHNTRPARPQALSRADCARDTSPTEALLRRVENITEAFADGNRRWTRHREPR